MINTSDSISLKFKISINSVDKPEFSDISSLLPIV